jgi:hypothetical protein
MPDLEVSNQLPIFAEEINLHLCNALILATLWYQSPGKGKKGLRTPGGQITSMLAKWGRIYLAFRETVLSSLPLTSGSLPGLSWEGGHIGLGSQSSLSRKYCDVRVDCSCFAPSRATILSNVRGSVFYSPKPRKKNNSQPSVMHNLISGK